MGESLRPLSFSLALCTNVSYINLLLLACSNFHITCFFADVNECEQFKGICEFQCVNTIGSFECRCTGGGVLNPDQRTCSGTYIHYSLFLFDFLVNIPCQDKFTANPLTFILLNESILTILGTATLKVKHFIII